MRKKHHILFFRKRPDFILSRSAVAVIVASFALAILVILLILWGAAYVAHNLENEPEFAQFLSILLSVLGAVALSLLGCSITLFRKRSALNAGVKRAVYTRLEKAYSSASNSRIKMFLYRMLGIVRITPSLEPCQNSSKSQLLDMLESKEHNSTRIWLEGPSYSGKTTVLVDALVELASNKTYEDTFMRLDHKIVYLDFSCNQDALIELEQMIDKRKLDDRLILIDGLHSLPPKILFKILNAISNARTFSSVVITRSYNEFLEQEHQETLLDEYKRSFNTIRIDRAYHLVPSRSASPIDWRIEQHWKSLHHSYPITQHFQNFVYGSPSEPNYNVPFIALIVGCMFTGKISLKYLRNMTGTSALKTFFNEVGAARIAHISLDSETMCLEMHESLAQAYAIQIFKNNKVLMRSMFKKLSVLSEDAMQKMLYSKLSRSITDNQTMYDEIFDTHNFKVLRDHMEFLERLDPECKDTLHRELGIVYDRLGNLEDAEKRYRSYYEKTPCADALFKAIQVNHSIFNDYQIVAKEYQSSENPYERILARYWIIHLKMHSGIFDFDGLSALLQDAAKYPALIIDAEPYSGAHLIRRIYFDCFRMFYLCGVFNIDVLVALDSSPAQAGFDHLHEFDSYRYKFVYGHYLHYDVLFRMGTLKESVSIAEINKIVPDFAPSSNSRDSIMQEAIRHACKWYEEAFSAMERSGDKTEIFVKCRYYEIQTIQQHYDKALKFYSHFQSFAEAENENYYQGCAHFYYAKTYAVRSLDPQLIAQGTTIEADRKKCLERLRSARECFRLAHSQNPYIDVNLIIYESTFTFLENVGTDKREMAHHDFREALRSCKKTCDKHGYRRQSKLIKRLLDIIDSNQFNIEALFHIFRYYPFVAQ